MTEQFYKNAARDFVELRKLFLDTLKTLDNTTSQEERDNIIAEIYMLLNSKPLAQMCEYIEENDG